MQIEKEMITGFPTGPGNMGEGSWKIDGGGGFIFKGGGGGFFLGGGGGASVLMVVFQKYRENFTFQLYIVLQHLPLKFPTF